MNQTFNPENITRYLEQNLPAYLDLLREMVEINSFTSNTQGVDALGDLTADAFSRLGFTAEREQCADLICGRHLILTRNGRPQPNGDPAPKIGLISHLDTVYPAAEERDNNFHWRVEGDKLYGPGTYDIKGGTVMIYMIMDTLQRLYPAVYDQITWIVALDAAEEVLIKDFGELCRRHLGESALAALVFEGGHFSQNQFSLVVSRKGMARYRIEVEGKAAHAGTSHHMGASAIVQMADVVQRVASFTNHEQQITFNAGTIAGGTVINRVPHYAVASVEMRAFDASVFAEGVKKMTALNNLQTIRSVSNGYPCRVQVNVLSEWDPWPRNAATQTLLELWQETAVSLGYDLEPEDRGGLSDGNQLWDFVPTIDGLGPMGGNAHCSEYSADGEKEPEYALASSFVPKALLNVTAILKLAARDKQRSASGKLPLADRRSFPL